MKTKIKTKIVKLKNGMYARIAVQIHIRSTHTTKREAEWHEPLCKAAKTFLAKIEARQAYRDPDSWATKCDTLARSWRKRTSVLVRTGGFLKSKTSVDWYASCRTMHTQFLKRLSRLEDSHERWKYWANNKASNQAKRIRSREANLW